MCLGGHQVKVVGVDTFCSTARIPEKHTVVSSTMSFTLETKAADQFPRLRFAWCYESEFANANYECDA
jgi:hypothetical protein